MTQQNGVAKRMNRTLMEKSRSMLNDAGLTQDYWAEAIDTACYLVNKSTTLTLVHKTPYDAWDGKNPPLSHLNFFGCDAFVHILKEKRSKLDNKSEKCIFIGYKNGVKGYNLWNPMTRTTIYSRDVIFREFRRTSENEKVNALLRIKMLKEKKNQKNLSLI